MWNSLGSLRDRVRENAKAVRENAKAAAQVAQGVLIAAAAEDDEPAVPVDPTAQGDSQDEWDAWEQPQKDSGQRGGFFAPPPPDNEAAPPPPPPPFSDVGLEPPPPPPDGPPPPPPEDGFGDLPRAVPPKPTRKRATRYVEAGLTQAKVPVAPPRPTAAIFQPLPMDVGVVDSQTDMLDPTKHALQSAEKIVDSPSYPSTEQPAGDEAAPAEGNVASWGDEWGVPAELQEPPVDDNTKQEVFGWGAPTAEQSALSHEGPDRADFGEAPAKGFGWEEPAVPNPAESQQGTQGGGVGGPHTQAFVQNGSLANDTTAEAMRNLWQGAEHNNGTIERASEQQGSEQQGSGIAPPVQDGVEWDGGAEDDWNVPTQDQPDDKADWNLPTQSENNVGGDWDIPVQEETTANVDAWNISAPEGDSAKPEAWIMPADKETNDNTNAIIPVQREDSVAGGGDSKLPEPKAADIATESQMAAETEIGRNDWDAPGQNHIEPIQNTTVTEEAWDVNQAPSNGNVAESFAWGQSDAGQSSANDTGVDWFSGQSVQPETSDPTQSEVSASEDLFSSHSDGIQQHESNLPAPEPSQFNGDVWSSVVVTTHSALDSSVSDTVVGEGSATGPEYTEQRNNVSDREPLQNVVPEAIDSSEMGASSGTSNVFWSAEQNVKGGASVKPDPQCAGMTDVVPRPVEPSGTVGSFLPEPFVAAGAGAYASADESAAVIAKLREEIESLKAEKSSAVSAREASDRNIEDLKRSILELKDDMATKTEDLSTLSVERDDLLMERGRLADEKVQAERERDAAIEQGGDGIREARSAIEVMRSSQDVAEKREAIISEQIHALRFDLDRISGERNSLLAEADDLRNALKQTESESKVREEEMRQQLRIAENQTEIAQLEREKALTASQLHIQEHKDLLEAEQTSSSSLAAYQSRVEELENAIASLHRERDEELLRIETFSSQVEDMKERTTILIEERNDLYEQKISLQKEVDAVGARDEQAKREVLDVKRELTSLSSERDEARQRYATLRDQLKDTSRQVEAISVERDQLLRERTAAAAGSSSNSDKEKSLHQESQRKTAQVAALQRKLSAAAAKIEKLTVQRGTFQRQRDEAGARLRAAGGEFAMLNTKLQAAMEGRESLQNDLVAIRDDRDKSLARVQELSEIAAQKKLVDENVDSLTKQLEDVRSELGRAKEELTELNKSKSTLQQKYTTAVTETSAVQGQLEVAIRERDMLQSQQELLCEEKATLQQMVKAHEGTLSESGKKQKTLEAELATAKDKASLDIGILKAELSAEEKIRMEDAEKLKDYRASMDGQRATLAKIREVLVSSVRVAKHNIEKERISLSSPMHWPVVEGVQDDVNRATSDIANACSDILGNMCAEISLRAGDVEALRVQNSDYSQRLKAAEFNAAELVAKQEETAFANAESDKIAAELEVLGAEKKIVDIRCQTLEDNLVQSEARILELDSQMRSATQQMKEEIERGAQISSEERVRLMQEIEKFNSNMKSIWGMLQKTLANQHIEMYTDDIGDYDEMLEAENVAVLALRATASIVAELDRNRATSADIGQRLSTAEAEVARLVDRAEIAEQERDAYKGTNERLERKADVAFAEGEEAAKSRLEEGIAHIEDELEDTKEELRRVSEKTARSEKEAGELRALCIKLTAQFNGRTNELDEAEEKVVYLQDQVTNLEEDLEEAHRRLKSLEEESTQARKSDVDRLTAELQQAVGQVETLEKECAQLRESCDAAENTARESELLAETHRKAEENLQIAIEQLEAAQDSAVEQRTIQLQERVQDAEERCEKAVKREEGVVMTENKLSIRDEEIKELRGAIGRLADERVELKLELEKSLSRLNHPDAGGQLVDRRVVRQLLISYFRVGSIRRRDVLELMSRMLAFSDADNVAVGLKRRALIDRIGSLVQPPELDDASLPPLGTVSDKWIEFLMQETEDGDEQSKGW